MNLNLLKESFVGFIRARGMGRHFDRLGMDMFRSAPLTKEVPQTWRKACWPRRKLISSNCCNNCTAVRTG